jgi:hypothetical protein
VTSLGNYNISVTHSVGCDRLLSFYYASMSALSGQYLITPIYITVGYQFLIRDTYGVHTRLATIRVLLMCLIHPRVSQFQLFSLLVSFLVPSLLLSLF